MLESHHSEDEDSPLISFNVKEDKIKGRVKNKKITSSMNLILQQFDDDSSEDDSQMLSSATAPDIKVNIKLHSKAYQNVDFSYETESSRSNTPKNYLNQEDFEKDCELISTRGNYDLSSFELKCPYVPEDASECEKRITSFLSLKGIYSIDVNSYIYDSQKSKSFSSLIPK